MNTCVAWIDDSFVLMVETQHIQTMKEQPAMIDWAAKHRQFPLKFSHSIDANTVCMTFEDELPMGEVLFLHCAELCIPVYPRAVVRTDWFDQRYAQTNQALGALYGESATTFSLWAPTATSVRLCLDGKTFRLEREAKGIWQKEINGDWHGFTYQYEVTVNGTTTLVNDPYAKGMLANSEKSVVIDFAETNPMHFMETTKPALQNLQDAIIYELHVRDATVQESSGVHHKGKFLGLTELGTMTENSYSTGLSYLKELGYTHVQLLPIHDFARVNELDSENDYNWGYDPLFFQVPEGSYATLPNNPITRIKECKKMIQAFHQAGIAVILDVVYNHVFIMEESPFEKIVPGYYFRYHADGRLSNGTGVGNDLATERKMVQQFILDTIDVWLTHYRVDGFRFDLMGAMDIDTMQKIRARCEQEETPIMLLGEGWHLDTALAAELKATSSNAGQLKNIGFFNDYFRDSVKGNLFDANDKGYINGGGRFIERMAHLVTGSVLEKYGPPFVSDVNQTINYVECHDNHTLWDRLQLTNGADDVISRKKMHQLATGITLLSQGIPFIHAGQEWFGTKQGDENSYISGDAINQLDWEMREAEDASIGFIKSLIAIRKKHAIFRLQSKEEIAERFRVLNTPAPIFGYTLLGYNDDFAIYINPTNAVRKIHLPSSGRWQVLASNYLSGMAISGEFMELQPYELIVLKRALNQRDAVSGL